MIADFYPPDRRRRDLDNLQKSLWDAIQYGGGYRDDSQIKDFECHMARADATRRSGSGPTEMQTTIGHLYI